MNSAVLLIPILIIRYGFPIIINRDEKSDISFFMHMIGLEWNMYIVYQLSTFTILGTILFSRIEYNVIGCAVFLIGTVLFALSTYSLKSIAY